MPSFLEEIQAKFLLTASDAAILKAYSANPEGTDIHDVVNVLADLFHSIADCERTIQLAPPEIQEHLIDIYLRILFRLPPDKQEAEFKSMSPAGVQQLIQQAAHHYRTIEEPEIKARLQTLIHSCINGFIKKMLADMAEENVLQVIADTLNAIEAITDNQDIIEGIELYKDADGLSLLDHLDRHYDPLKPKNVAAYNTIGKTLKFGMRNARDLVEKFKHQFKQMLFSTRDIYDEQIFLSQADGGDIFQEIIDRDICQGRHSSFHHPQAGQEIISQIILDAFLNHLEGIYKAYRPDAGALAKNKGKTFVIHLQEIRATLPTITLPNPIWYRSSDGVIHQIDITGKDRIKFQELFENLTREGRMSLMPLSNGGMTYREIMLTADRSGTNIETHLRNIIKGLLIQSSPIGLQIHNPLFTFNDEPIIAQKTNEIANEIFTRQHRLTDAERIPLKKLLDIHKCLNGRRDIRLPPELVESFKLLNLSPPQYGAAIRVEGAINTIDLVYDELGKFIPSDTIDRSLIAIRDKYQRYQASKESRKNLSVAISALLRAGLQPNSAELSQIIQDEFAIVREILYPSSSRPIKAFADQVAELLTNMVATVNKGQPLINLDEQHAGQRLFNAIIAKLNELEIDTLNSEIKIKHFNGTDKIIKVSILKDGKEQIINFSNVKGFSCPHSLLKPAGTMECCFSIGGSRGINFPFKDFEAIYGHEKARFLTSFLTAVGQQGTVKYYVRPNGEIFIRKKGYLHQEQETFTPDVFDNPMYRRLASRDDVLIDNERIVLELLDREHPHRIQFTTKASEKSGRIHQVTRAEEYTLRSAIASGVSLGDETIKRIQGLAKTDERFLNPVADWDLTTPETQAKLKEDIRLAQAITQEIKHLHQQGFMHNDIKPENFFYLKNPNGTYTINFIDFATASASTSIPLSEAEAQLSSAELFAKFFHQEPDSVDEVSASNAKYTLVKNADNTVNIQIHPKLDPLGPSKHGTIAYLPPMLLPTTSLTGEVVGSPPISPEAYDDWAATVLAFGICNKEAYFKFAEGRAVKDYVIPNCIEVDSRNPSRLIPGTHFNQHYEVKLGRTAYGDVMYVPSNRQEGEPLHLFKKLQKLQIQISEDLKDSNPPMAIKLNAIIQAILTQAVERVSLGQGFSNAELKEKLDTIQKVFNSYQRCKERGLTEDPNDIVKRLLSDFNPSFRGENLVNLLGKRTIDGKAIEPLKYICLHANPSNQEEVKAFLIAWMDKDPQSIPYICKSLLLAHQDDLFLSILGERPRISLPDFIFHLAIQERLTKVEDALFELTEANHFKTPGPDDAGTDSHYVNRPENALFLAIRHGEDAIAQRLFSKIATGEKSDSDRALLFSLKLGRYAIFESFAKQMNVTDIPALLLDIRESDSTGLDILCQFPEAIRVFKQYQIDNHEGFEAFINRMPSPVLIAFEQYNAALGSWFFEELIKQERLKIFEPPPATAHLLNFLLQYNKTKLFLDAFEKFQTNLLPILTTSTPSSLLSYLNLASVPDSEKLEFLKNLTFLIANKQAAFELLIRISPALGDLALKAENQALVKELISYLEPLNQVLLAKAIASKAPDVARSFIEVYEKGFAERRRIEADLRILFETLSKSVSAEAVQTPESDIVQEKLRLIQEIQALFLETDTLRAELTQSQGTTQRLAEKEKLLKNRISDLDTLMVTLQGKLGRQKTEFEAAIGLIRSQLSTAEATIDSHNKTIETQEARMAALTIELREANTTKGEEKRLFELQLVQLQQIFQLFIQAKTSREEPAEELLQQLEALLKAQTQPTFSDLFAQLNTIIDAMLDQISSQERSLEELASLRLQNEALASKLEQVESITEGQRADLESLRAHHAELEQIFRASELKTLQGIYHKMQGKPEEHTLEQLKTLINLKIDADQAAQQQLRLENERLRAAFITPLHSLFPELPEDISIADAITNIRKKLLASLPNLQALLHLLQSQEQGFKHLLELEEARQAKLVRVDALNRELTGLDKENYSRIHAILRELQDLGAIQLDAAYEALLAAKTDKISLLQEKLRTQQLRLEELATLRADDLEKLASWAQALPEQLQVKEGLDEVTDFDALLAHMQEKIATYVDQQQADIDRNEAEKIEFAMEISALCQPYMAEGRPDSEVLRLLLQALSEESIPESLKQAAPYLVPLIKIHQEQQAMLEAMARDAHAQKEEVLALNQRLEKILSLLSNTKTRPSEEKKDLLLIEMQNILRRFQELGVPNIMDLESSYSRIREQQEKKLESLTSKNTLLMSELQERNEQFLAFAHQLGVQDHPNPHAAITQKISEKNRTINALITSRLKQNIATLTQIQDELKAAGIQESESTSDGTPAKLKTLITQVEEAAEPTPFFQALIKLNKHLNALSLIHLAPSASLLETAENPMHQSIAKPLSTKKKYALALQLDCLIAQGIKLLNTSNLFFKHQNQRLKAELTETLSTLERVSQEQALSLEQLRDKEAQLQALRNKHDELNRGHQCLRGLYLANEDDLRESTLALRKTAACLEEASTQFREQIKNELTYLNGLCEPLEIQVIVINELEPNTTYLSQITSLRASIQDAIEAKEASYAALHEDYEVLRNELDALKRVTGELRSRLANEEDATADYQEENERLRLRLAEIVAKQAELFSQISASGVALGGAALATASSAVSSVSVVATEFSDPLGQLADTFARLQVDNQQLVAQLSVMETEFKAERHATLQGILELIVQFAPAPYTPAAYSRLRSKQDVTQEDIAQATTMLRDLIAEDNTILRGLMLDINPSTPKASSGAGALGSRGFNLSILSREIRAKLAENRTLHESHEKVLAYLKQLNITEKHGLDLDGMVQQLSQNYEKEMAIIILGLLDDQEAEIYENVGLKHLIPVRPNYHEINDVDDFTRLVGEKQASLAELKKDYQSIMYLKGKLAAIQTLAESLTIELEEIPSTTSLTQLSDYKDFIEAYYERQLQIVQSVCLANLANTQRLTAVSDEIESLAQTYGRSIDADEGLRRLCQALKDLKDPRKVFPAELISSVAHSDMFIDIILDLQAQIDAQNKKTTEITELQATLNVSIRTLSSLISQRALVLADKSAGKDVNEELIDLDAQISTTDALVQETIARLKDLGVIHIDASYTKVYETLQSNLQLELIILRRRERELNTLNQGLTAALEEQHLQFARLSESQNSALEQIHAALVGESASLREGAAPIQVKNLLAAIGHSKAHIEDLSSRLRDSQIISHQTLNVRLDSIRARLEANLSEKAPGISLTSERFGSENPLYLLELTLILESLLGQHQSLEFTPKWSTKDLSITLDLVAIEEQINGLNPRFYTDFKAAFNTLYSVSFSLFMGKQQLQPHESATLEYYESLEIKLKEKLAKLNSDFEKYRLSFAVRMATKKTTAYQKTQALLEVISVLDSEAVMTIEPPVELESLDLSNLTKLESSTKAYVDTQQSIQNALFNGYVEKQIENVVAGLAKISLPAQEAEAKLELKIILNILNAEDGEEFIAFIPKQLEALKGSEYTPAIKAQVDSIVAKTMQLIDSHREEQFAAVYRENDALREENATLNALIVKIDADFADLQSGFAKIHDYNKALSADFRTLAQGKALSDEEVTRLAAQLDEQLALNREQDKGLARQHQALEKLESQMLDLTSHNGHLEQEIGNLTQKGDALSSTLHELQSAYAKNQAQLQASQSDYLKLNVKYALSLKTQTEQTATLKAQTQSILELEEQLGFSARDNQALRQALRRQEQQIEAYQLESSEYEAHVLELRRELEAQQHKNEVLEAAVAKNTKTIHKLNATIGKKKAENEKLRIAISDIKEQLRLYSGENEDLELNLAELRARFDENRKALTAAEDELASMQVTNQDLKRKLTDEKQYTEDLSRNLITLEEALSAQEKINQQLQLKIERLEQTQTEFVSENQRLAKALKESENAAKIQLRESLRTIRRMNTNFAQKIASLEATFSATSADYLADKEAVLKILAKQESIISRQRQELEDNQARLRRYERENQNLQERNQVLAAEIENLESDYDSSLEENEAIRQRLEAYHKRYELNQASIAANEREIRLAQNYIAKQVYQLEAQQRLIRENTEEIHRLGGLLDTERAANMSLREKLRDANLIIDENQRKIEALNEEKDELIAALSQEHDAAVADQAYIARLHNILEAQDRELETMAEANNDLWQELGRLTGQGAPLDEETTARIITQQRTIAEQQEKIHALIQANTELLAQVQPLSTEEGLDDEASIVSASTNSQAPRSSLATNTLFQSGVTGRVVKAPSYEIFAHKEKPENCRDIASIKANNLGPAGITLKKDENKEVYSSSGQAYHFKITAHQSVANLHQIDKSADPLAQAKLAITTINILQNVLINHEIIQLNTKNQDIQAYAKCFINLLNKKYGTNFKLIVNGREVSVAVSEAQATAFASLDLKFEELESTPWFVAFSSRHNISRQVNVRMRGRR